MRKTWLLLLLTAALIVACNLPGSAATTTSPNAVQTAAAMTVAAALQTSGAPQATGAPPSTAASPSSSPPPSTSLPPTTPAPTNTPQPPPTATPQPCNLAHFVADVTVPDGTVFTPNEAFTKTWRLQNVGTCTWHSYSVVFDHGDAMGAAAVVPIPGSVAPGQQVDISIGFTAPATAGEYKGYWRLRDDKGVVFGLTTGNPFWVDIKVENPTATPTITPSPTPTLPPPAMLIQDLYAVASSAHWTNGSGDHLPFPGATNDSRGFARYADGAILEDGHTYTHVLETHPQWVSGGRIFGYYPTVSLPPHTHFRAKIGFILPSGGCGAGSVDFVLTGFFNGNLIGTVLHQWHETCDGHLHSIDVDLSSYAGNTVSLSLEVKAGPSSAQDWAVWISPLLSTP